MKNELLVLIGLSMSLISKKLLFLFWLRFISTHNEKHYYCFALLFHLISFFFFYLVSSFYVSEIWDPVILEGIYQFGLLGIWGTQIIVWLLKGAGISISIYFSTLFQLTFLSNFYALIGLIDQPFKTSNKWGGPWSITEVF